MSSKKTTKDNISGWDKAMRDARQQIEQAKLRIGSLERSIEIFKRKIDAGEPWPGISPRFENVRIKAKNHVGV